MGLLVGMGPVLGVEGRLGGHEGGSQLGGGDPRVLLGRDRLPQILKQLPEWASGIASEYRQMTEVLNAEIKPALRKPFNSACETVIKLEEVALAAGKPDLTPQEASALAVDLKRLSFQTAEQFQKNIEGQRVRYNNEPVPPSVAVPEAFRQACDLFGRLNYEYRSRLDGLRKELELRAAPSEPVPVPVPVAVPQASPSETPVETAPLSPQPAAVTPKLPSPYQLAAMVGEPNPVLAEACKKSVAAHFCGKGNLIVANVDGLTAEQRSQRGIDLNSYQVWAHVQTPGSPVAPLHWLHGAERLKDEVMRGAREVFGRDAEEAIKLKFDRGLVVIQDLGAPADSRSAAVKLFQRMTRASSECDPAQFSQLAISIIPPRAIEECGDNYKRTDQRMFMVNVVITVPKDALASLAEAFKDDRAARGGFYKLIEHTSGFAVGIKEVFQRIEDGILGPLAGQLLKLREGTKWWELQPGQKEAVAGWFDVVFSSPETAHQLETTIARVLRGPPS